MSSGLARKAHSCGCGNAICVCSLPRVGLGNGQLKRPLDGVSSAPLARLDNLPAPLARAPSLSQRLLARTSSGGALAAGGSDGPPLPPPPLPASKLARQDGGPRPTTFLDVATRLPVLSDAEQAAQATMHAALPATLSLIRDVTFRPDAPPLARAASYPEAAGAGAPAVVAQRAAPTAAPAATPPTWDALPWDWSLKTEARFTSNTPFDWATALHAERSAAGLSAFLGGEAPCGQEELLARALLTCSFPDAPWPASVCTAMAKLDGGREVSRRRERWAAALRSLYFQLRTGRCDCFYVVAPDAFSVLFCAPGVRDAPADAPAAVLSPSTRGLRMRLAAAGVPFAMPLAPDADAGAEGALAELREYERANPGSTRLYAAASAGAAGVDGTPASALLVRGAMEVHSLLNFLHNYKAPDSARDVPMLLAGVPFEHAAVQPLQLLAGARQRMEGRGVAAALGGREDSSAAVATSMRRERIYVATVRAATPGVPLGPWNLARLCEVLRSSQDGEFSARFDTLALTPAFNLVLQPAQSNGAGMRAEAPPPATKGRYVSDDERAAARQPLGWRDEVMTAVACRDGAFYRPPPAR